MIEALAAVLKGPKLLSARVVRVVRDKTRDAGRRARVYYQRAGRIETEETQAVVLAVPFTRVHSISKVRPIYHYLVDRVRAHVFLCMLAYYVEWHMRQALAPCSSTQEPL